MAHALAEFIQQRMDEKRLRQRDVVATSGLSRALVSKYAADDREKLARIPERGTLEGFAKALGVPLDVLIGKAIESLGLGYTSGDFVNDVANASDRDLLDELERRLTEGGGAHAGGAAPTSGSDSGPVPLSAIALKLLDRTDWDPSAALALIEHEPDTAKTAMAADEIRELIPLSPTELKAARRSKKRPPRGPGEQGAD